MQRLNKNARQKSKNKLHQMFVQVLDLSVIQQLIFEREKRPYIYGLLGLEYEPPNLSLTNFNRTFEGLSSAGDEKLH